jgi:hypothetical protein
MTQLHTIEGTWEWLIENHSDKLAGHRVKVTILPEEKTQKLDQTLADLLDEAEALEGQEPNLSGTNNDVFSDELTRKYRNQGFEL